ncbi:MAG: hypothetical protein CMO26_14660 [Thiotrichales bacterium]|nr:hypothetical protein [Thiotrichales bacterium]
MDATEARNANEYLRKHQLFDSQITDQPEAGLGTVVVIPCHDEPRVLLPLRSLWAGERASTPTEVIVVFNSAAGAPAEVVERNRQGVAEVQSWRDRHPDNHLRFWPVLYEDLRAKHAGVGLARKLGMDEAVARFQRAGTEDGVIASLDADCLTDPNYLPSLEAHFRTHSRTPACSVYFEHWIDSNASRSLARGAVLYELYMRYYLRGLRQARYANAFHTLGSCMAVRNRVYQQQGGMNRRKGGEDFYFLNKVINIGGFSELNSTRVRPEARASERAPFGTGAALTRWLCDDSLFAEVVSPRAFESLSQLLAVASDLRDDEKASQVLAALPASVRAFLDRHAVVRHLAEIRANTSSAAAFERRFLRWFDALKVLKFLRFATTRHYGGLPLLTAVGQLLAGSRPEPVATCRPGCAEAWLELLRNMDKAGMGAPT